MGRGQERYEPVGARIGVADGLHLTVVYTDRKRRTGETVRRIISVRRSNRHERKIYQTAQS
jgi:uncharacterized DUF497 family protein